MTNLIRCFCRFMLCCFTVMSIALLLAGCSKKDTVDFGAMAGVVLLGEGEIDQHAGSLVFLPGTSFSARTDQAGRWTITSIPSGSYQVMAEHNGYQTINLGKFAVDAEIHKPGRALELPTIVLQKDASSTSESRVGSIAGAVAVLDAESGADVKVVLEGTDEHTITDEAGVYFFDNVDPGRYVLTFTKTGYQEKQTSLLVRAGSTPSSPKDVILEPVGGSKQLAMARSNSQETTGPTQPYRDTEDNLVAAQLKGNCSITGSVVATDSAGAQISDFSRVVVAIDNSDYQIAPDNSGRFSFAKLPQGKYRVYAFLDSGAGSAYTDVDLTIQQAASIVIKVAPAHAEQLADSTTPGIVKGKVVLYGPDGQEQKDASGATVGCLGTKEMTLTNADGTFELSIKEGRYGILFSKQGFNSEQMADVDVIAGQTTEIGTVGLNPNVDAPYVTSTMPGDGDNNVMLVNKLPVIVIFSKSMNSESVRNAVSWSPDLPGRVYIGSGGHPRANDQTLVVEFDNSDGKEIKPRQTITLSLSKDATDLEGNKLREAYEFSFKTGGLGVIATSPANGQVVNYLPGSILPVDVFFNCSLDQNAINSNTVSITPALNSSSSPPMVMTDPITGWSFIRFLPYFQGGKNYRVTVNRGLRDVKKTPLTDLPYTFSFQLNDAKPSGAPPTATRRR